MQLVIFHYHLNRGGVTSVIENHLRSLALLQPADRPTRVGIVYGGRAAAWNEHLAAELPFDCQLFPVPELEYDNFREAPGELRIGLMSVLDQFDRESTILHVHNHSLGKNAEMAPTVGRLANDGWRVLLQIHDFAEDLRPANYRHLLERAESAEQLRRQLYPQANQIHYAVLNGRDQQVLDGAGVRDERLHLLPNPVKPPPHVPTSDQVQAWRSELSHALALPSGHRFVLYPVRPIRRKNIGEFLLWSMLAEDTTFALTLAPLNPEEQRIYQQWVEFALELQLPVRFEVATKIDLHFEEVYAAADAIITTSVAEGFGLVYLEASMAGRPLVGRELPSVCGDFLDAGMQFPGLVDAVKIPTEQLDMLALRECHRSHSKQMRVGFGLPPVDSADESYFDSAFQGDAVDFARLESGQQRDFLRQVHRDAALRTTLREWNPTVRVGNSTNDVDRVIEHNRRVIGANYSPQVIGEKLRGIYRSILASDVQSVTHDESIAVSILARFVSPALLYPLRLES